MGPGDVTWRAQPLPLDPPSCAAMNRGFAFTRVWLAHAERLARRFPDTLDYDRGKCTHYLSPYQFRKYLTNRYQAQFGMYMEQAL